MFKHKVQELLRVFAREGRAAALYSPWLILFIFMSWAILFVLIAEDACEEKGLSTTFSFKDYHVVYSCEAARNESPIKAEVSPTAYHF